MSPLHCFIFVLSTSVLVNSDSSPRSRPTQKRFFMGDYDLCRLAPEVKAMCEECAGAGFHFQIDEATCCHDQMATAVCEVCLLDRAACQPETTADEKDKSVSLDVDTHGNHSNSSNIKNQTRNTEAKSSNDDGDIHLIEHLDALLTPPEPHNELPKGSSVRFNEENFIEEIEKRLRRSKRWLNPFRSILSLFPQRLNYGHTMYIQGRMAHRPRGHEGDRVVLATMKRSGDHNKYHEELDQIRTLGLKSRDMMTKAEVVKRSALQQYNSQSLGNAQMYAKSKVADHKNAMKSLLPILSTFQAKELGGSTKSVVPSRGTKQTKGTVFPRIIHPFQTLNRDLPRPYFDSRTHSWVTFPWQDHLGEFVMSASDLRDENKSYDFFVRLLIFVDALRHAAKERSQPLTTAFSTISKAEPKAELDEADTAQMDSITDKRNVNEDEKQKGPTVKDIYDSIEESNNDAKIRKSVSVSHPQITEKNEDGDNDDDNNDAGVMIQDKPENGQESVHINSPQNAKDKAQSDSNLRNLMRGKFIHKKWGSLGAGKFRHWWLGKI